MITFKDPAVTAMIKKCGSHVVGVYGSAKDGPSLSYTVGLYEKLGFELLIVGMNPTHGCAIFNHIHEQMLSDKDFKLNLDEPDARWCNGLVVWKKCANPIIHDKYTVQADNYWGKEVPAVQMIMSDRAGVFPWQPGYDVAHMGPLQPLLYESH